MHRTPSLAAALAACLATAATAKEPITLSAMGSFHVGGRFAEITGQAVREVVFTPGGVPARGAGTRTRRSAACSPATSSRTRPSPT